MSRCGPWVGQVKPKVWKDTDSGIWHCDQELLCKKCGDLDWGNNEYDSWAEAMEAVKPEDVS